MHRAWVQQSHDWTFWSMCCHAEAGLTMALRAEPNSYGGGNGGAYAVVAVLQAGLALPAYLVPHEVRSMR